MQPTGFVSDFHLTLTAPGQGLNDRNVIQMLAEMREDNVPIVLATSANQEFLLRAPGLPRALAPMFDAVVLEGGGVVWVPDSDMTTMLAPAVDRELLERLAAVIPAADIWNGATTIGSRMPHRAVATAVIADLAAERLAAGLPESALTVIENGATFTVTATGHDKAASVGRVFSDLFGVDDMQGLVGSGDGPNDRALLAKCGVAALPANAHARLRALPNALVSTRSYAIGTADAVGRAVSLQGRNARTRENGRALF